MENVQASFFKIFAAEDDPVFSKLLKYILEVDPENEVYLFQNGESLLKDIHLQPDLITLDYNLPDTGGEVLLQQIKKQDSKIPVWIISGQDNISTAIKLLKNGASDYFCKDHELKERLLHSIQKLKRTIALEKEILTLKSVIGKQFVHSKSLLGHSKSITHVKSLIEKALDNNITVSICGETGTGKELVAKAIHYGSKRKNKPFVSVNIASIPHDLLEYELWGYERGAFAGAISKRIGKFEEAHLGTLFLDEISEMPLHLQAKILRILQEQEVTRIGSNIPIPLQVRILVSSHKNLKEEVQAGRFRQDLYYRLLGLQIEMPALRDRKEDIPQLAKTFLLRFCHENEFDCKEFSEDALVKLVQGNYPGNVRELKAIVELAAVLSQGAIVQKENIMFRLVNESENNAPSYHTSLLAYTYDIVKQTLIKNNGDIALTAAALKIGKSTIYKYMQAGGFKNK